MSIQDCKQDMLRIGVDVGSTTVKLLVLDPDDQIVFSVYRRHHSDVRATIVEIIDEALEAVGDGKATITITGSGGLLARQLARRAFRAGGHCQQDGHRTHHSRYRRRHRARWPRTRRSSTSMVASSSA